MKYLHIESRAGFPAFDYSVVEAESYEKALEKFEGNFTIGLFK